MSTDQQKYERFKTRGPVKQPELINDLVQPGEKDSPLFANLKRPCPDCHSSDLVKFGYRGYLQRYRCKSCNRTFTNNTGTYLEYIHKKEKFEEYKQLMSREHLSLQKMCDQIGISLQTAFDWRHKLQR